MKNLLLLLPIVAVLAGCASSPPPPNLHSLAAQAPQAPLREGSADRSFQAVITQVAVPESVDRPQLVVQQGAGIDLVEGERWTEPLKRAIPRLLAADLMQRLGGVTVWSMAGAGPARPDARISVEINRFESQLGRESLIEALWLVRAGDVERSGRTVARTPVRGTGYDALVAAHRSGLLEVSDDIAAALRPIAAQAR